MKNNSEPGLLYYDPQMLSRIVDQSDFPLTWAEMVGDSELGYDELTAILKLAEKADLSIGEVSTNLQFLDG